jgi:hypothetical protein
VPGNRLDIQQIPLILRPTLHPHIIPTPKINRPRLADYFRVS